MHPNFDKSSRSVLNSHTAELFQGDTLFQRLARTVCEAGCLPRKELYEAWEVAKRVRRKMRGGPIYDLAAGHGLLAAILLILDDSSPLATCVDVRMPPSRRRVLDVLEKTWPRLIGRIEYVEAEIDSIVPADTNALVASVHACGRLTDRALDVALQAGCRVAVLPCCHNAKRCDAGRLKGWLDVSLAIDVTRVFRLETAGYRVVTQTIPEEVTPKNRLLLGWPP